MSTKLEKEIAGKEAALENMDEDARDNLEKDISGKKKRLENLKGYTKNKEQIEGIRKFKVSLQSKLVEATKAKSDSEKAFDTARKLLIEANKKLANEKYTMTLDQDEYNNLLQEKADAEKETEKQSDIYFKSKRRVEELTAKISKCDLAWKTLFVNKSWDDIQRIATSENVRFTRKVSEKTPPLSEKKKARQKSVTDSELDKMKQHIGREVSKIKEKQEKGGSEPETKALVEKKEGFFSRMWSKLKSWVRGDEKEPTTENKGKKSKTTEKVERDAFLDGLRQHVDVQYKQAVRAEKDRAYREAHQSKPREEADKEER